MADDYLKFAHGKKEDMEKSYEEGLIDEKDLVITSDTDEMYYIDEDGEFHPIGARTLTYTSEEEALEELNNSDSTYAGQTVMIMNDNGVYEEYIVQNGEDGSFTIEQVQAEAAGLKWTEF